MPQQKPGRSRQDVETPKVFLDAVKQKIGIKQFDCDLAASLANAVCPKFYTEFQNALVQPWTVGDGWNFLNPPFSRLAPWVQRAWEQEQLGAQTAVLVPAGVGSNWWKDWVHGKAHVLILNGRITFVGETDPYPKDLCLLLYSRLLKPTYGIWRWQQTAQKAAA